MCIFDSSYPQRVLAKIGGVAALVKAVGDIANIAIFLVLIPVLGISFSDLTDPKGSLAAFSAHPALAYASGAVVLLFAGTTLVLSLALYERLQGDRWALVKAGTALGLISAALFGVVALNYLVGVPELVQFYKQGQPGAVAAWAGSGADFDSLMFSALFAFGCFLICNSWAAISTRTLPRSLAGFGLAFGVVALVVGVSGFAVPTLVLLPSILGIPWGVWLGVVLIRGMARARQSETNLGGQKRGQIERY